MINIWNKHGFFALLDLMFLKETETAFSVKNECESARWFYNMPTISLRKVLWKHSENEFVGTVSGKKHIWWTQAFTVTTLKLLWESLTLSPLRITDTQHFTMTECPKVIYLSYTIYCNICDIYSFRIVSYLFLFIATCNAMEHSLSL